MFRAGQTAALDQLLARLKEINKGIVNDFAIKQNTSITDDKAKAYLEANEKIRKLFEAWADERAPVFSKLTMVTGFPDPGPSTKESDPAQKPSPLDQTALANQLRTKLSSIDLQFKQKSDALLEGVVQQTHAAQAELIKQIEQKRIELETKAEMEAKAQIRRAVSKLQFRLADSAPVILPETPARHVTIPAEKALEAPPQVPSSGILEEKADRKRLLEHELRIWLALNRYTLSESRTGHRDATQEFQIWRQQHGAGP